MPVCLSNIGISGKIALYVNVSLSHIDDHMEHKLHIFEKLIGLLVILTVLSKYSLITFINIESFGNSQQMISVAIVLAFFIFAIMGSVGIFLGRLWGYIGIYIFIPLSCFGLGIATVPFIVKLVPVNFKTTAVIILSIMLLLSTVLLHMKGSPIKGRVKRKNTSP